MGVGRLQRRPGRILDTQLLCRGVGPVRLLQQRPAEHHKVELSCPDQRVACSGIADDQLVVRRQAGLAPHPRGSPAP